MIALAIHGGAARLRTSDQGAAHERAYRAALGETLDAGCAALQSGGNALEVVAHVIVRMEDSGLYNAGRGAVANHDGWRELDAAIMDGATRAAGAVACVRRVRNPILLALRVLERSPHVLLAGSGAEDFARTHGLELVDDDYYAPRREVEPASSERTAGDHVVVHVVDRPVDHGTVGAVALDRHGSLAAGTSTGGTSDKGAGRVGDSPLVGAGTYAANERCAVSATGTGEYFIRAVAAHDVAARMAYRNENVQQAVDEVLAGVARLGGDGGLIALDAQGRVAMAFNTQRMYRGYVDGHGIRYVGICA